MTYIDTPCNINGPDKPRSRWIGGKWTFWAVVFGASVAFENAFRYSIFMYTSGGAIFWLPYLFALTVFGLPILLMELTVGQMFQRSAVGVMRAVHPRLIGVGISQAFCALLFTTYYMVIIGQALLYFAESFRDPLKWGAEDFTFECSPFPAQQYYFMDVLKILRKDGASCVYAEPGDISTVNV